jgi:hypothetical protein
MEQAFGDRKLPGESGVMFGEWRSMMDQETKHEIVVLTLSTLAAAPVVTGVGLAIVTGILTW